MARDRRGAVGHGRASGVHVLWACDERHRVFHAHPRRFCDGQLFDWHEHHRCEYLSAPCARMSPDAICQACFLIPLGVAIYVVVGGMRATLLCD